MKNLARFVPVFLSLALVLAVVSVPLAAQDTAVAPAPSLEVPAVASVDAAPEACAQPAEALAPAPIEQAVIRPLPHCGDPCYNPGAAQGCIDWQGYRTQCYCSSYNNTWTCGP